MDDRTQFTPAQSAAYLWQHALHLPAHALDSLSLVNDNNNNNNTNKASAAEQQNDEKEEEEKGKQQQSSSFKIAHLAQSCIGLAGLAAATVYSVTATATATTASTKRINTIPQVRVSRRHALTEFFSERVYTLNGSPPGSSWGRIGGLYQTAAGNNNNNEHHGYVRIHDAFANHETAALALLGLHHTHTDSFPSRHDVARAVARWDAVELETAGIQAGAVIAALRSYQQWDAHPQARAVADLPILLRRISNSTASNSTSSSFSSSLGARLRQSSRDRCLRGLRVLELSRVIAAPVAGRTLAAHGADVLWVTTARLADQPALDRDLARGKRSVRLDFKQSAEDRDRLVALIREADVLIQSYRPGSLDAYGFGLDDVIRMNPRIVYASLSAYGSSGPWATRRGFDSLVQTCSGMNVSEAEHAGSSDSDSPARALPCQALDHASGYFLATGIMAAVYHQVIASSDDVPAYEVQVSLAGTMKWLRSLGQYQSLVDCASSLDDDLFETRTSAFGELRAVRHAAQVDGAMPGFDFMPRPLGSDEPRWLA